VVVTLIILFIFSTTVVAESLANALFNEIHLALSLMFIFLLEKNEPSIHTKISSDNHQIAVLNIGAITQLSAINL